MYRICFKIFYATLQIFFIRWIKLLKFAHASIGYLIIIYSQYVIITGLYTFDASTKALYFIQMGAILITFVVIEVAFYSANKAYYNPLINVDDEELDTISLKQFYGSNKTLALFNNYVVDLTAYAFEHPGGTYLIQQCNKKEIGKYMYGAFSMENKVSPHRHSFIAMKILERLIIAKIAPLTPKRNSYQPIRGGSRYVMPKFIDSISYNIEQTSICNISKISEFSKNLYCVTFEDLTGKPTLIFREGLSFIGKHYVVVSRKNRVARYYTICQSFHSKIYQQYLDTFDNILTGKEFKRKFETIEQISNETSNSIEVFMKFYKQSKNGITKQISEATKDDKFTISGVFGKGFNLEKHNIVGTNLIVVGGTGILPFIDLFAYLARRLISKKDALSEVFPHESFENYMSAAKFIVYAYYPDKSNAVGVEFWDRISRLFQLFDWKDLFKFIPQYTKNGDKKLSNQEDIATFIHGISSRLSIKNIFVWGPPPMNNLFQRATSAICWDIGLDPSQIEIIH